MYSPLYEDREGTIWVGCYDFTGSTVATSENGGLNSFNRSSEKFTRYKHNAADNNTIADNNITAMFEDSRGNFWVGTGGNGLHIMNRATGKFTHFFYDPSHPENLSRPPLKLTSRYHIITVIAEKRGRHNKEDKQRESAKSFKKLRRAHSAVESNINMLEHHGLNRCVDKGLYGYKRNVGLSVLAYNLHIIGNHLIEQQKRKEEKSTEDKMRYLNRKEAA